MIDRKKRKNSSPQKRKIVNYLELLIIILLVGLSLQAYWLFLRSLWKTGGRINLLINSSPVVLASFSPSQKNLTFILVPPQTVINVIHGYGQYQLGSIFKLGQIEKQEKILGKSFAVNFALPIDSQLASPLDLSKKEKNDLKKWLLENLIKRHGSFRPRLNYFDLPRLILSLALETNEVNSFDLAKGSFLEKKLLPDGITTFILNQEKIDQLIKDNISDPRAKTENLAVAVRNATQYSGLAAEAGRVFTNLGSSLVSVENLIERKEKTVLLINKNFLSSQTARKIADFFQVESQEGDTNSYRADLVLILGEDYWRFLNLPLQSPQGN